MESDWRLTNQHRYLHGVTLRSAVWGEVESPEEHDHCSFCWATFAAPGSPDALQVGYTTPDRYHWVCPECFADFCAQFEWKLGVV